MSDTYDLITVQPEPFVNYASQASVKSAAVVDRERLRKTARNVFEVFERFAENGLTTTDATWKYVEYYSPLVADTEPERIQEFANARARVATSILKMRQKDLVKAYGVDGVPVTRRPDVDGGGKQDVWCLSTNPHAVEEYQPARCPECGHALPEEVEGVDHE